MNPAWSILGSGGVLALIGSIVAVIATRRHDKATEEQGQFKNDIELNKYIRDVVDKAVEAAVATATAPLNQQIEAQNRQIAAQDEQIRKRDELIEKFSNKDRIMSWFVQRLYWWDDGGRNGTMPRLTYDEQKALDLDLFPEDTRPPIL